MVHNPAMERIVGTYVPDAPFSQRAETYGLYRADGVTPFPSDELPLARAARGEASNDVEVFIRNARRPEGVYVSINARPMYDRTGALHGGVILFRDVSRIKKVEAELQKHEIRQLSKELGLPTWNKPGGACLASRIPYGSRVTLEKLRQVDQAEHFLHKLGFRLVRVRHHGDIARIEAPPEDLPRLFQNEAHTRAVAALKEIGFKYVALDMQGYRSGSLNETLAAHTIVPLQTV